MASEIQPLQKISDENRNIFVNAINNLEADGGTCLGEGLKQGLIVNIRSKFILLTTRQTVNIPLQTLNGKGDSSTGGAIIFITDGKHDCRNGGLDIDDKDVLDLIKDTKARIITVAFG